MELSSMLLAEFIGTAALIFIGTSTNCANGLRKSAAIGSGWVFIAFGWGLAVLIGATIAGPISGGHLNPAVSLAFYLTDPNFTFVYFISFMIVQILGAILGAYLTMILYKDHFDDEENGDAIGYFSTGPTYRNTLRNYYSEIIGTMILVLTILMTTITTSVSTLTVPLIVVGIGIAIGNVTGYAINPARDLGPRIAYKMLFKHKSKGSADFKYAHVPFIGPLVGSAIAVVIFSMFN